MKIVFVLIFSVISFLGAIGQSKPLFSVSNTFKQQSIILSSAASGSHASGDYPTETDCHDGEVICHTCHLGHCSFTIGFVVSFGFISLVNKHNFFDFLDTSYDFHSNPFRPPIV